MFFSSEFVTEGHPDKACGQVSDAVLDECLRHTPGAGSLEHIPDAGGLIIGGEITTRAMFNVNAMVRKLGNEIGYSSSLYGCDVNTSAIVQSFYPQSSDIDHGISCAAREK